MANGSGKLVNNLAESLVDALSESKDLNLMNNERFSEFTDLLQSLSTKIDESKKQNSDKIEAETQLLYDALLAVLNDISGRVYRVDDLSKFKNKDIHKEGGKEAVENQDQKNKKLSQDKKRKGKDQDSESGEDRIMKLLEKMPKSVAAEIRGLEKRQTERSVKMERSIKKTVKSRVGKLWSIFKKLLIVGLLIFFAPILKNAFSKMADVFKVGFNKFKDMTEPLWRPFIDWFKKEFPTVTNYIIEIAGYVKDVGSAVKKIADGINSLIEWKDENKPLVAGIEGAITGASLGALVGSVIPGLGNIAGALLGGLLGFGVGALGSKLKEHYANELNGFDPYAGATPLTEKEKEEFNKRAEASVRASVAASGANLSEEEIQQRVSATADIMSSGEVVKRAQAARDQFRWQGDTSTATVDQAAFSNLKLIPLGGNNPIPADVDSTDLESGFPTKDGAKAEDAGQLPLVMPLPPNNYPQIFNITKINISQLQPSYVP